MTSTTIAQRRPLPHRSGHGKAEGSPVGDPAAPLAVTGRYLPALDGLRAFAVAGVFAYHLGLGWARGGYLGVDLFFVLSGFLITSLLLEQWARVGAIKLAAFWARRARRLLPALFVMLCALSLFVALDGRFGGPGAAAQFDLSGLRGDALATLSYVANWHSIFAHQSYFAQFAAPSPLQHTWSLAIEEQFYLVWPPVLLAVLVLCRRHHRSWRAVGTAMTVAGALVSVAAMALLYHPGGDPMRAYFGTDTRAFDILIGAAAAMVVAAKPQPGWRARSVLHGAAPLAALVLGVFWLTAGTGGGLPTSFMFDGGFLLCALLAALVVADTRQVHLGPLGRLLALRPIRWIGRISYGVYLWHWPVIVYLTGQRTGLSGAVLDLTRAGLTVGLAAASYYLVELPIRRRTFGRNLRWTIGPACALATAAVVVVSTVPAVAVPPQAPGSAAAARDHSVPGAGGFSHETPIALPAQDPVSPSHPLRVLLMGDSVLYVAARGIGAAFGATGEATVMNRAFPGFGLSVVNWRTAIPMMISQLHPQVIVATWSWDDNLALHEPVAYRRMLAQAVRLMLARGDGVDGVIFSQFPPSGPDTAATGHVQAASAQRAAAQNAWDRIVRSLPSVFPGRVMYLPVASSVLLNGRFTTWLPPANDPGAPKSTWVRVRMVDNVHMCPAGVVRYADALLSDLGTLFHLRPAAGAWWLGSWTAGTRFNTPPGACPDDHPPS